MKTYLIVDVSYLIYRAYFAYPDLTFGPEKTPVGALFGFIKTILALLRQFDPDELIFACDTSSPTWRHQLQSDYKAGRKPLEDNMRSQIGLIQNWCQQVTPHFLILPGLEADDLIASSVINLQTKHSQSYESNQKTTVTTLESFESKNNLEGSGQMTNFLDFRATHLITPDQLASVYQQSNLANLKENFLAEQKSDNLAEFSQNAKTSKVQDPKLELTRSKNQTILDKPVDQILGPAQTFKQDQEEVSPKILIFSKDRDLFQLLVFNNVFFVDINKGIPEFFGQQAFKQKYQLEPYQWLCYKTLVGDSGDNLPGIAGIGPKTATEILQTFDSVDNFLAYRAPGPSLDSQDLSQVKTNYDLVDIFQSTQEIESELNSASNLVQTSVVKLKLSDQSTNKINKLLKWQSLIDSDKIAYIRRLSSLCWIDLDLKNLSQQKPSNNSNLPRAVKGFDLSRGLDQLHQYGFKSLVTSLQNLIKPKDEQLDGGPKNSNNQPKKLVQMDSLF